MIARGRVLGWHDALWLAWCWEGRMAWCVGTSDGMLLDTEDGLAVGEYRHTLLASQGLKEQSPEV
eukprot:6966455-Ditylum_brightwellii.AAC.1